MGLDAVKFNMVAMFIMDDSNLAQITWKFPCTFDITRSTEGWQLV